MTSNQIVGEVNASPQFPRTGKVLCVDINEYSKAELLRAQSEIRRDNRNRKVIFMDSVKKAQKALPYSHPMTRIFAVEPYEDYFIMYEIMFD
jgi:hypothetical protein